MEENKEVPKFLCLKVTWRKSWGDFGNFLLILVEKVKVEGVPLLV